MEITIPQHTAADDTKPELDLVKPRAVGRGVVEEEAIAVPLVPLRHEIALARISMCVEVIENDVDSWLRVS